jgi:hypothetical protein
MARKDGEFCRSYAKGSGGQNLRLRAKLLERAIEGNVFLLWKLACSRLGYTDTPAVQVTATATAQPTFTVTEETKRRVAEFSEMIRRESLN